MSGQSLLSAVKGFAVVFTKRKAQWCLGANWGPQQGCLRVNTLPLLSVVFFLKNLIRGEQAVCNEKARLAIDSYLILVRSGGSGIPVSCAGPPAQSVSFDGFERRCWPLKVITYCALSAGKLAGLLLMPCGGHMIICSRGELPQTFLPTQCFFACPIRK